VFRQLYSEPVGDTCCSNTRYLGCWNTY